MVKSYIRNLDSLRALAVVLVMMFHCRIFAAGWVGVWVFFVISGFLITRTLVDLQAVRFREAIREFYIRRTLRIWPAYYLFLLMVGILLISQHRLGEMKWQYAAALTYTYNLLGHSGGVGGRALSHVWSLSVEEQFYLVVAPVVLLLRRSTLTRLFAGSVVACLVLRAIMMTWLYPRLGDGVIAYVHNFTLFQADSFLVGGLLALGERRVIVAPARTVGASLIAIVAVGFAALAINAALLHARGLYRLQDAVNYDFSDPASWSLSPTSLGMSLLTSANGIQIWLYSVLAALSLAAVVAVLRFGQTRDWQITNRIGRVSYGMYLVHMPMIPLFDAAIRNAHVVKHSAPGLALFGGYAVAVWSVAWFSFRFVESPFLRLKPGRHQPASEPSGPPHDLL